MNRSFSFLFLLLVLVTCEYDRELDCSVIGAKSGYVAPLPLTYDFNYIYTYAEGRLTNVKKVNIDSGDEISTTEFKYDTEGRVSLETTKTTFPDVSSSYRYYKYERENLIINSYTVFDSDTIYFNVEQYFYVENPLNKVYHHRESKSSLKFQNGNLIEYGTYEVSGSDTTDSFYERYFYDNNVNYYSFTEFRVTIPSDFIWAKVVSKNNLVRAQYIDGGWDFSYLYKYDNNRLIQFIGKSGIVIDFEYNCK